MLGGYTKTNKCSDTKRAKNFLGQNVPGKFKIQIEVWNIQRMAGIVEFCSLSVAIGSRSLDLK